LNGVNITTVERWFLGFLMRHLEWITLSTVHIITRFRRVEHWMQLCAQPLFWLKK